MSWVLIIIATACNSGCGVSIAQVGFDSRLACEQARAEVTRMPERSAVDTETVCVQTK